MEWYDTLSDEQIAWWKCNRVITSLLNTEERKQLHEIPDTVLESSADGLFWQSIKPGRPTNYYHRLRPDWKRPKKFRWYFDDQELDEFGCFWHGKTRYRWCRPDAPAMDGFVGIIFEWRNYRILRDVVGRLSLIDGDAVKLSDQWEQWAENPSVEPPLAVGVRFRKEVADE